MPTERPVARRLELRTGEARWHCPRDWLDRAHGEQRIPPLLRGRSRGRDALSALLALARPDAPHHLAVVAPEGSGWSCAIAAFLKSSDHSKRPIVTLERTAPELLRGTDAPGDLHGADGGLVVVEIRDLLAEDGAWAALSEAMALRSVVRNQAESSDATHEAKPCTDPTRISAVLVGSEQNFKKLRELDSRVPVLVPRKVTIAPDLARDRKGVAVVAGLLREHLAGTGGGRISSAALGWLVEEAAGATKHRYRISLSLNELYQCLEEARIAQPARPITQQSVRRAANRIRHRSAAAEDNHRARVAHGQVLMTTTGKAPGIVNGLMVYGTAPASYCIPGRITARTWLGREGLVNIEREAKYSGRSFDKGLLLLGGYLRSLFAQDSPLSLGATLAFEQSYGKVDGDSATLAEAIALLSDLSGLACRQDIAVTGAVNQSGELLPVGSINLKVVGWWKTCKKQGLTGKQGVLLPRATAPALQLPLEVKDDLSAGRFHLWATERIEDALELCLGKPAGSATPGKRFPPTSVYGLADRRLREMAERLHPKRKAAPRKARQGESARK